MWKLKPNLLNCSNFYHLRSPLEFLLSKKESNLEFHFLAYIKANILGVWRHSLCWAISRLLSNEGIPESEWGFLGLCNNGILRVNGSLWKSTVHTMHKAPWDTRWSSAGSLLNEKPSGLLGHDIFPVWIRHLRTAGDHLLLGLPALTARTQTFISKYFSKMSNRRGAPWWGWMRSVCQG